MPTDTSIQCITCKYCHKTGKISKPFQCRRFPPIPVHTGYWNGYSTQFPEVLESYFCGEYKYGPTIGKVGT